MRCSPVTNAIFLNLMIFGMGSYIYVLWSQYETIPRKTDTLTTSKFDKQIYLYNRGFLTNQTILSRWKHALNDNITYIKNSRPRIPSSNPHKFYLDTKKYQCLSNETDCSNKTREFKDKLLVELSNIFSAESNILKEGNLNNTYNVHYVGPKEDFRQKSQEALLCELMKTQLQTLKKADLNNNSNQAMKNSMPKRAFFQNKTFNSCAVVASAGALRSSNLGKFIDSHDVVLRFNHAPTKKFAQDVGTKTTVRVVNSQVVTKPEFNFLQSPLYKNVTLVLWDPSNYSGSLQDWFRNPEFDLFTNFVQYRKQEVKPRVYLLNPLTIWDVWDFLQRNSPGRLRKNPPSSGFLGLRLLLPHCNFVDVVEYVPSTRVTKRCHYFDPDENPACTFGVWHPLSLEKLLTYHLNEASDYEVFQKGFVRIRGFQKLKC